MNAQNYQRCTLLTAFTLLVGGGGALLLPTNSTAASPAPPKRTKKSPAAPAKVPVSTQTGFTDNTPLTTEQKITHLLNRIGFGPRPSDIERVQKMGMSAYIDQQLHPERIDDNAVDAKLAPVTPYLRLSASELAGAYADRQSKVVKLLKAQGERKQMDAAAAATAATPTAGEKAGNGGGLRQGMNYQNLSPDEREALMKAAEANQKVRGSVVQMTVDKTVRAVESQKQLQEILVDFWSNHFNIDVRKNACSVLKVTDEQEVIRKHALGRFRDLLGASAQSPAMLVYLDNALSFAPNERARRQERFIAAEVSRRAAQGDDNAKFVQTQIQNRGKGGINENYAREIMELHTLGVDGGYTQKDVQEVARCLTGWTVNRQAGTFRFDPNRHDNGEKTVLGHTIPAGGGKQDGEMVLDILASHPATMKFISTELCRRLVSDEPPASLVNKCVATWKTTDGDIREIVRTIVTSPEFYSRAVYRQKIKSPFEYAVSSARAIGATFNFNGGDRFNETRLVGLNLKGAGGGGPAKERSVVGQVDILGQPLYQYQAPTGYPEDSRKWVSSGALISRLNYALSLTSGRLVELDLSQAREMAHRETADPRRMVESITQWLLHGDVSPSTRATLLKQAATPPSDEEVAANTSLPGRLVALVLGSPEFQRR